MFGKLLLTAFTAALAVSTANATTIDLVASNGGTPIATGSFSYSGNPTDVTYNDMTSFSLTLGGVTFSLADVLSLTDYVYFDYQPASDLLVPNNNACGYSGCGFSELLGATNKSGNDGFFFNYNSKVYINYSTQTSGSYDTVTLTPAGAVPEPASWVMMLAGFSVVGYAMRKHKTISFV